MTPPFPLMIPRVVLGACVSLAGLLAAGAVQAQSPACQRYRAELAALERGGAGMSGAAHRQRAQIARTIGYFYSIGCRQGWFPTGASDECAALADRIRAMQATYGRMKQTEPDDSGARRRELLAAIREACQPQREARPGDDVEPQPRRGLGGGRIVCVRACDGFFFPLASAPGGRSGANAMCQALCPGAETAAFSMPNGENAALERAVSLKGKPYVRLAGAFKFQKSFDPACACRKDGQTWAQALARAEAMLGRRPGDIVVTAEKAEELSRPMIAAAAKRGRDKGSKRRAPDVESTGSVRAPAAKAGKGASIPTASRASAGVGPKSVEGAEVVAQGGGVKRETTDGQGAKRTVRIVGPAFTPAPPQSQTRSP